MITHARLHTSSDCFVRRVHVLTVPKQQVVFLWIQPILLSQRNNKILARLANRTGGSYIQKRLQRVNKRRLHLQQARHHVFPCNCTFIQCSFISINVVLVVAHFLQFCQQDGVERWLSKKSTLPLAANAPYSQDPTPISIQQRDLLETSPPMKNENSTHPN